MAAFLGAALGAAQADDFYRGKTLSIVVGYSAGGGYDVNARLLARHLGRHIPGEPLVVVLNMPGAATLTSVEYLDHGGAKDGTVIDIFDFSRILASLLTPEKVKVDFRRFAWIGSISEDLTVCYVAARVGARNLAEAKDAGPIHMGVTAVGSTADVNQRILKNLFGVDVRGVTGYPGSAEERLAIDRGELDGGCGAWSSIPEDWIADAKIRPLLRSTAVVPPDMPADVPYAVAIAPTPADAAVIHFLTAPGEVGRPFIASAAVPEERIRVLRHAFTETMRDPQFLAEAAKLRLPVSPRSGEAALGVVSELYAAPEPVVAAARRVASE